MRRLTVSQLRNTLRDLLGTVVVPDVEQDLWQAGFATVGASSVAISARGVEQLETAMDAVLTQVFSDGKRRDALIGCVPAGPADETCARSFLAGFGRRAWRRPLTSAQLDRYVALARQNGSAWGDFHEGARLAASAMLQSPYFYYRVEQGKAVAGRSGLLRLTGDEMAARLSYFLTDTMPDADLFSAAQADQLDTAEALRRHAQRLLASPKGRLGLARFVTELFELDRLQSAIKDERKYGAFDTVLRASMATELLKLFEDVAFTRNADVASLYDSTRTFADAPLAKLYGASTLAGSAGWTEITHPPGTLRAGLIGTAAFLSIHAKPAETSPTSRGLFIREVLLCQNVPAPPDAVDATLPVPPAGKKATKRQLFEQHRASPTCHACHQLLDPPGLALESFDAIGRFRVNDDSGLPIDPKGEFEGQAFSNALELARLMAKGPLARQCLVRNLYRFAAGRIETPAEEVHLAALDGRLVQSSGRLQELLVEIVSSDNFRFVSAVR